MTLKFGTTTWFSQTLPLEDSIEIVSHSDYSGVEIAGLADYFEKHTSLKRLLRQHNLELVSVSAAVPFARNPLKLNLHTPITEIREASIRYVCDCIDLAANLGGNLVYVTSVVKEKGIERTSCLELLVDSLIRCADYASDNGLQLALEDF